MKLRFLSGEKVNPLGGDYKTSFKIISNTQEIPFEYERAKDGLLTTTATEIEIDRAVDAEIISVLDRNIPYKQIIYRGTPEAIRDGEFKILKPSDDGTQLIDVEVGTFRCVRCGDIMTIPQTNGTLIKPFECQSDACGRKGPFTPLFPLELIKPVWKLPFAALECSAVGVYEDIYNYIKEYLILKPDEYHLMTLWIMASYLADDFKTVPYLLFIAPKESGKSQAMRILNQLSYRGFLAASVTPAALFRAIELWRVTLLIDEAEYQIKNDTESGQALYQVLNMGYKRDSFALRVEGDSKIPTPFDVFGFKAIASTKIFLPTLESRSIIIHMAQGLPPKIIVDDLRADVIRSELIYFRFSNVGTLPIIQPKSTSGRIIEIMTPLYTAAQIFKDLNGLKPIISYNDIMALLDTKIQELQSARTDEESESNEAIILSAIQKIKSNCYRDEPEIITLKEIAQELNWIDDRDPTVSKQTTKEATMKIGYVLKAMGIKTHRLRKGTGIQHMDLNISQRLSEMTQRYLKNEMKA